MNALMMMMLMLAADIHIDDKHFNSDNTQQYTYTIITTIIKSLNCSLQLNWPLLCWSLATDGFLASFALTAPKTMKRWDDALQRRHWPKATIYSTDIHACIVGEGDQCNSPVAQFRRFYADACNGSSKIWQAYGKREEEFPKNSNGEFHWIFAHFCVAWQFLHWQRLRMRKGWSVFLVLSFGNFFGKRNCLLRVTRKFWRTDLNQSIPLVSILVLGDLRVWKYQHINILLYSPVS